MAHGQSHTAPQLPQHEDAECDDGAVETQAEDEHEEEEDAAAASGSSPAPSCRGQNHPCSWTWRTARPCACTSINCCERRPVWRGSYCATLPMATAPGGLGGRDSNGERSAWARVAAVDIRTDADSDARSRGGAGKKRVLQEYQCLASRANVQLATGLRARLTANTVGLTRERRERDRE